MKFTETRLVATCSADQRIKLFRKASIDGTSSWELETEWKVRTSNPHPCLTPLIAFPYRLTMPQYYAYPSLILSTAHSSPHALMTELFEYGKSPHHPPDRLPKRVDGMKEQFWAEQKVLSEL
jgi:hypothetical protein